MSKAGEVNLALAQLNPTVGDISGNAEKIIKTARQCKYELGADILAVPEQAIIGYPAEDLLLRSEIVAICMEQLDRIMAEIPEDLCLLVGYPRPIKQTSKLITNHLEVCLGGKSIASYAKQILPSYQVFDEPRFFAPGNDTITFSHKGITIGVLICEDLWQRGPVEECCRQGARHIISINASPYSIHQPQKRIEVVSNLARDNSVSISYVNCCGGQDELVFDGYSFACNDKGEIVHLAPPLVEHISLFRLAGSNIQPMPTIGKASAQKKTKSQPLAKIEEIYEVLKCGLHDYAIKNGFSHAVLGLSGGIDSAIVACLAADALGPENVTALMLPHKYTSSIGLEDASALAANLNINYREIRIEEIVNAAHSALKPLMDLGDSKDITAQNIQPRIRALLLMALANKKNALLLATSNKSESAVGYSTLYGDMAGGYAPLKDVFKQRVYELAAYRNRIFVTELEPSNRIPIPRRIIERPPTAELYEGQEDRANLPNYDVLDAILKLYIEEGKDYPGILKHGFDKDSLAKVINMVDAAEYKRRQSPPGIRIGEHSFGKDRRYPITNNFPNIRKKVWQTKTQNSEQGGGDKSS